MVTTVDPLAAAKWLLPLDPPRAAEWADIAMRTEPTAEKRLLLAAARRRSGKPKETLRLLAPLAGSSPRAWGVHFELGMALAQTGDIERAASVLRRAVEIDPKAIIARYAMNDVRPFAGLDSWSPSIPGDRILQQMVLNLLGGDKASAGVLFTRFGLDRHDIAAICIFASIGLHFEHYDATAALLQKVLPKYPDYLPALLRLAEALHRAERDTEALAPIETVLAANPEMPIALSLRGSILMRLGREEDGIADFEKVTSLIPNVPHIWLAYGHGLRSIGRRDAAIAAYRRALAIDPALGEGYWSIADLKTASFTPFEVETMRAQLQLPDLTPQARSYIEFALGRAREDAGDYAASFAHYAMANSVRRSFEPYNANAHKTFIQQTINALDEETLTGGGGDPSDAPIFVVGMPRSGTSLVEQILASHSAVEGVSELPTLTAIARTIPNYPAGLKTIDGAALGADYLARVAMRRRTDRPRFVDKFPPNALLAGLIHLILPNARIIDVRRDPRDCCVSLFTQSFAAGQAYSYGLADLGHHYGAYVRMVDHVSTLLPGRILRVDYETLVDDLEGQTRRLLDHCGLDFEPQTLRFFENERAVRTASSEQVRQPIYRSSIGRWKRFEPWLDPLIKTLALQGLVTPITGR